MKFTRVVLENGLTVLHEKRDTPVTTLVLAAKYGSLHETTEEKGMAHFIEHLCFKGTEKRSAAEIAFEIESVGGDLNAFTHEEVTAYYAKLPSVHLARAADVIFDIFFNASFPEAEVSKEANVICEEIKMYRDNPRAHVFDQIKGCLYEAPFGMNIAGTEELVRGMSRADLMAKHRAMYAPSNAILCVVGNNELDEVVGLAKQFSIERQFEAKAIPEIALASRSGSEDRAGIAQTNLVMGLHFPLATEEARYAAAVFSMILGQGMSSRLFREVREKRGLVYGVKSDIDAGKWYGYFIIWAGTDSSKTEEVFSLCKEEFGKMAEVTEAELAAAKERLIGGRAVDSEASNDTAIHLILEEIFGNAEEYYSFADKVNAVDLAAVRLLAQNADFSRFHLGPKTD